MRICVFGAGAVGSHFAVRLANAGHDVSCVIRGAHLNAIRQQGRKDWKLEVSAITDSTAHWEPTYRFSASGRLVHNVIDAEFEFDSQGLIKRHRDRFDFWRWSRQALGLPGVLLGWSGFLRGKVRRTAARRLDRYLQSHAAPERRVG